MSFDPYQILGIERDASDAAIRLSYLTLAKTLHPDAAGMESEEAFKKLQAAYAILKDPEKKAFYDQTGMVMGEDMEQGRILTTAAGALEQVLMTIGDDPTIDLVKEAITLLEKFKQSAPGARKELESKKKKYEKLLKKLIKRKGGGNPIAFLFEKKVKDLDSQKKAIDQELNQVEKAIELLGEYQYEIEKPSQKDIWPTQNGWASDPNFTTMFDKILQAQMKDALHGKKR